MSVTGLPATVITTLNALLIDNVSSWKVAGESGSVVFVLQMKPADKSVSTEMADPVLNRNSRVQYYRKKPPCQIRRNLQRSRQHQERQASRQCGNDSVLEEPVLCNIDSLFDVETEEKQTSVYTELCVNSAVNASATPDSLDLLCDLATDSKIGVSSEVSDVQEELTVGCTVDGSDTGIAKQYVSTLTDKRVQRRLQDSKRNTQFRKVVVHSSGDQNIVMCESDDIALEYSCNGDTGEESKCMFWYITQEEKNMLPEERVRLARLRKGKQRPNTQHAETVASAERQLHLLRDLIRFYMG